jgi:C-terminal processing protease CtpA/Prc
MSHLKSPLAFTLSIFSCISLFPLKGQPTSSFKEEKVFLTTQIIGLMTEYQPEVFTGAFNLDQRFIEAYATFLAADNKKNFNQFIEDLIQPLTLTPVSTSHTKYRHIIANELNKIDSFKDLSDKEVFISRPDFGWIEHELLDTSIKELLAGVIVHYSPKKRQKVKKQGFRLTFDIEYSLNTHDAPAVYTLGMIHFWTKINYFFPYKDLMDLSWGEVLRQQHALFMDMNSRQDYYKHLKLLGAYLDDSHGFISINEYQKWAFGMGNWAVFPLKAQMINDQLIISDLADRPDVERLKKGDTITHINGQTVEDYAIMLSKEIIASNPTDSIRQLSEKIIPTFNHPDLGPDHLKIIVDEQPYTLQPDTVNFADYYLYLGRTASSESEIKMSKFTALLDITNMKGKEMHRAFRKNRNKENLILDLRGYPNSSIVYFLARNLSKKAKPVVSFAYPVYDYPGTFQKHKRNITYYISNYPDLLLLLMSMTKGKTLPTLRRPYQGDLYVLIDENTLSFAETIGMMIKTYRPDAVFIGRPSNGANGDVISIPLPGDVSVVVSGLNWQFADGKQLQRVGLAPDIYVARSVEEMVYRKDQILRKALKSINTN